MTRNLDITIFELEKGNVLSSTIEIPREKSTFNKNIVIQLIVTKTLNGVYQLEIEKYYEGQWDGEISIKTRIFKNVNDLVLYIENNYSIKFDRMKIFKASKKTKQLKK